METTNSESASSIDARVRIGHVHLKVAVLKRALDFYCGVLGFELMQRFGSDAAFVSAGGSPPAPGTTGLYHLAILYPTRSALSDALRRLIAAGISLEGASDHGVSEALYLSDPDGNGIELYWDRPSTEWPRGADGAAAIYTRHSDLAGLLASVSGRGKQCPYSNSSTALCRAGISCFLRETTWPRSNSLSSIRANGRAASIVGSPRQIR